MQTRPCRYCANEIAATATLCPVCRSYQSRLRNNVLFAAGAAGFITLVVSALVFTVQEVGQITSELRWKDNINVGEFDIQEDGAGRILFINNGDGPVFVSDVVIFMSNDTVGVGIGQTIPVKGIVLFDNIQKFDKNPFEKPPFTKLHAMANETGEPTSAMLDNVLGDDSKHPRCIVRSALATNNSGLRFETEAFAKQGLKRVTERSTARVYFYSGHTGTRLEKEFPVVVTYETADSTYCQRAKF